MIVALLVIDVQVGLIKGAYREESVVRNINTIIARMREAGGLVIFIQHCHDKYRPMMKGEPGWPIDPRLDQVEEDWVVEKTASDAFYQTNLNAVLQENGITTIVVTGLQTEYCVDTTCRRALSHGYEVVLISDAHATGDYEQGTDLVIDHHNMVLTSLAHPHHQIKLCSTEAFQP